MHNRNVRKRGGDLADGQVDTVDLADAAATAAKIATGAVGSIELADLAVGTAELQAAAVIASKIADGAVGTAELGTDAVDADAILAGAVGHPEIADSDVRPTELSDDVQRNQHVGTVETAITGGLATVDYCIAHPRAEADLAQTSPPSGGTVFRAYPDAAGAGSADFIMFGS